MKVILTEDVPSLGTAGQTVDVAKGYARNYLFPRKLALEATSENLNLLEHEKRQLMRKLEQAKRNAEALAEKISNMTLTFSRSAGESDKLFGSVTSLDIYEALSKQGIKVDRKKIQLPEAIKQLGEHIVPIRLQSSITAELKVVVIKTQ